MAEDDEVDVLGDFTFDVLNENETFDGTPLVSQNSDLLNCDYTIHPQWLLDRPSANPAFWYDSKNFNPSELDPQLENTMSIQQNSISDESGWTEKEKELLKRGIEIFGKSNLNLSQFIGSKTPAEVKYFLKNFYSDVPYTSVNNDMLCGTNCIEESYQYSSNVLQDNEIPASIEEIIESVSTAKSTTVHTHKKDFNNCTRNDGNICSDQSLKSRYAQKHESLTDSERHKTGKAKFKAKLNLVKSFKSKTKKNMRTKLIDKVPSSPECIKDLRIVTGNGLGVPVSKGEQVIKIIKENDVESDLEIDVVDNDDDHSFKKNYIETKVHFSSFKFTSSNSAEKLNKNDNKSTSKKKQVEIFTKIRKVIPQLAGQPKAVLNELHSLEQPKNEVVLNKNDISDVEKYFFYEFFEGRPTKTPHRYLHIRNFITEAWHHNKPKYLRKTSVRNGLKQAGDVNIIGRIHSYLEQIGAINFGCEQISYIRPLLEIAITSTLKEKHTTPRIESAPRQRFKKKTVNIINNVEGGYTLTHDEKGKIVNTTIFSEEPTVKRKTDLKAPAVQLIYCKSFTENYQKFSINLDISTLILMDLHAHMHLTEVMGLIGGYWMASSKKLLIKRYIPCRNIASSLTHCDMCPLSQASAADLIHNENLDILGWYHSHPTFAPEPSQQDMETQLSVQQWIGNKSPCIGFILSPFSLHGALIASPYRCMIVHKADDNTLVPYKFKVDLLLNKDLSIKDLLESAKKIFQENCADSFSKNKIDFGKSYFQDNSITYLDKYIYSVKMHLAKCSHLNKMTCDTIINGLINICSQSN